MGVRLTGENRRQQPRGDDVGTRVVGRANLPGKPPPPMNPGAPLHPSNAKMHSTFFFNPERPRSGADFPDALTQEFGHRNPVNRPRRLTEVNE